MKFLIRRVSDWRGVERPCKNAYQEPYIMYDIRGNSRSIESKMGRNLWLATGKNHREENECFVRDFDKTGWFVNIEDLRDLLNLELECGALIVDRTKTHDIGYDITIYDGFIE